MKNIEFFDFFLCNTKFIAKNESGIQNIIGLFNGLSQFFKPCFYTSFFCCKVHVVFTFAKKRNYESGRIPMSRLQMAGNRY